MSLYLGNPVWIPKIYRVVLMGFLQGLAESVFKDDLPVRVWYFILIVHDITDLFIVKQ